MDSFSNIDWGSMAVKAVSGLLILIVTFILAMIVKYVVEKLTQKIPVLKRQGAEGEKLGSSLGSIASLVIWLFGLVALLGVFELDNVLNPVTNMLDVGFAYLPNIVAAVFVFVIGLMIARIARTVTTTALGALDIEKRFAQLQGVADKAPGGSGRQASADGSASRPAAPAAAGSHAASPPAQSAPSAQPAPGQQQASPYEQPAQQEHNAWAQTSPENPQSQAPAGGAPQQGVPPQQAAAPQGAAPQQGVPPQAQGYGSQPSPNPVQGTGQHGGQDTGWEGPAGVSPQPDHGTPGGSKIANTLGSVVYGLIIIVVAIASLQILGIEAISGPAEQMLTTTLNALPHIIAAGLLIFLGVVIGRFVAKLLGDVLDGVGLDNSLRKADLLPEDKSVVPTLSKIVLVAIVLFFGVMAAQLLGFPQITDLLGDILALGGNVVLGALIIAAGFFIANFLAKILTGYAATIVKYVTIVLFVAIGLQSMGLADSIIQIAFGALVIGGAAAAVLAFGLGGRDAAARTLGKLEKKAEEAPKDSSAT